MARNSPPTEPDNRISFVDGDRFALTDAGLNRIQELWRQVVAGYVNVPCVISQDSVNALQLTPVLHREGGAIYGTGMMYSGKIVATTTGLVTAQVGKLGFLKVFKLNGTAQADTGDLVIGGVYNFLCDMSLDSNAGGLVTLTFASAPVVAATSYESAQTTYTNGGTLTFAHGLGVIPKRVHLWAVNQVTAIGVAVGAWLAVQFTGGGGSLGIRAVSDATNIVLQIGSTGVAALDTAGNGAALAPASWKLVVVAYP